MGTQVAEPVKGMVACMMSEWGDEVNPGSRGAKPPTNTSGQAYLTENFLCFHAMMRSKAISVPVGSITAVTPLSVRSPRPSQPGASSVGCYPRPCIGCSGKVTRMLSEPERRVHPPMARSASQLILSMSG
jgi:hypothetical protein